MSRISPSRSTGRPRPVWLGSLLVVSVLASLLFTTLPVAAQDGTGRTVALRILVVSTGTAETDAGLDLIDDVLAQLGVPYDVLDSSVDILDESTLAEGSHGFYNGIILTESELFLPPEDSGFTPVEWQVLQDYERSFGVRESIIGGAPTGDPSRGLDYGMDAVDSGVGFDGAWVNGAGSAFFGHVNTANNLDITDFAFVGVPRDDGVGPLVTPLLVNAAAPEQALVSHLQYPDGREVLLSSVTNAWFLIHSQVLAYEFVDFATRGLYLGSRRVYFNTHIDDLFLGSAVWDTEQNVSSGDEPYRNSAADIETTVAAQRRLNEQHPSLDDYSVEFAFNAFGSRRVPLSSFAVVADTTVSEAAPHRRGGTSGVLRASSAAGGRRQILARFDLGGVSDVPIEVAGIRLVGSAELASTSGTVCRVAQAWSEAEATWSEGTEGVAWDGGDGPTVAAESCVDFTVGDGNDVVDLAPLLQDWQSGQPNNGVRIDLDGAYSTAAREVATGLTLALGVQQPLDDALTDAVVANADELRFLNHTFTHRDMDASNATDFDTAFREISVNLSWWSELGLPGLSHNRRTLVTGQHSGLSEDQGTFDDLNDDIAFPEGANPALLDAAEAMGIRYLAADVSRPGQEAASFVGERDLVILPRYPTGVFFNVRTPEEMTDEYNWIFNESYVEQGTDPCEVPGAACEPRSYADILANEADIGLRHMLAYRPWPHYFHIANVLDHDGQGSTLLFDWLDSVLDRYEDLFVLPVVSPDYEEIGQWTADRLVAEGAEVGAVLDLDTGTVTLTSDIDVAIEVTGVLGGAFYGRQSIARVSIPAGSERVVSAIAAGARSAGVGAGVELDRLQPQSTTARARLAVGDGREALVRFAAIDAQPGQAALLVLPDVGVSGPSSELAIEVCAVSEPWEPGSASWLSATDTSAWSTGGGAAVQDDTCVNADLVEGQAMVVDVSAAVGAWTAQELADNGLVVRSTGPGRGTFGSFDQHGIGAGSPELVVLAA